MQTIKPNTFHQAVLTWYDQHGRKNLPWQVQNAYYVWLSEVMLQQTQVKTVLPFFERFIARFPTITALAHAAEDDVLHHWSGLGYYARARNLHKTAKIIAEEYHGNFPDTLEDVITLPGIGRSTAGAILSFAYEQPCAILDGNVKRVLSRVFGIDGYPGHTAVAKRLWTAAETYTPTVNIKSYNQAMMDIGALLCLRTKPKCTECPLQHHCVANKNNTIAAFPGKKPKTTKPVKRTHMLLFQHGNYVLLYKRPPSGIWGGLWSFPEIKPEEVSSWSQIYIHTNVTVTQTLPLLRHTFTHFHLEITPMVAHLKERPTLPDQDKIWYNVESMTPTVGLAKPVQTLLSQLSTKEVTA